MDVAVTIQRTVIEHATIYVKRVTSIDDAEKKVRDNIARKRGPALSQLSWDADALPQYVVTGSEEVSEIPAEEG